MIYILGAGSLGLLWAARLARKGQSVTLLVRDARQQRLWQAAGNRLELQQNGQTQSFQVITEHLSGHQPIDYLLVCTKATDSLAAVQSLRPRLAPDCEILLMQNGLGSQQAISRLLAPRRVLWASVTDGAWRDGRHRVVWAGAGQTLIGDPQQGPPAGWLRQFDGSIDWLWVDDIEQRLWLKLAVNCAINPYTVLFDCHNGEVPLHAGAELDAVILELQSLLQHQGLSLTPAALGELVHSVIVKTAANSSSMRQDVHAGRQTEIDYILGHALCQARQHGLRTPLLADLHSRLRTHLQQAGIPTG